MLLTCKVNEIAPDQWEALISVVFIPNYEVIAFGIRLKLNDVLINILKIHFLFLNLYIKMLILNRVTANNNFRWLKFKALFSTDT